MNPYKPPAETNEEVSPLLPLKPISAAELFGLWILIVVLPTLILSALLAVYRRY